LESYLASAALPRIVVQTLSVIALMISLTLAGSLYRRNVELGGRGKALALMLVFFSIGIVRPIQGYDVCIYAMAISLCSLLSGRLQLAFLVPALLLWRPTLPSKAIQSLNTVSVADLGWLLLLIGCICSAARIVQVRPASQAR
jgi:hypothetical protein